MTCISPYTAKRRKARIAGQLRRRIEKSIARLPECEWVLAYRYLGETQHTTGHEWHAISSHCGLVANVISSTGVFDKTLLETDGVSGRCPMKPRSSVARASQCRIMLRDRWLRHVKGTPFEGKVQMYRLVRDGECSGFPWWARVVGPDVPFTNDALNSPEVSSRVWDFLVAEERRKK